jgi:hypothetical protein
MPLAAISAVVGVLSRKGSSFTEQVGDCTYQNVGLLGQVARLRCKLRMLFLESEPSKIVAGSETSDTTKAALRRGP